VHLLSCLPFEWHTGSFKGLCARGGMEVDVEWADMKLVRTRLRAKCDASFELFVDVDKLNSGVGSRQIDTKAGDELELSGSW
jgi:alpha-L-fucosidase 2